FAFAYSYATEGRERRFVRRAFSQYMDTRIVNHILSNPEFIKPGGQKRKITVFFTDIAGFTTLAESLPPEQTARILHTILNSFTEIIIGNGGIIDKYIGDAIMAFWGAPLKTGRDEINACRASIQCSNALDEINRSFRKDGLNEINIRIGIHTGEAIVGNLGSDRLFDFTAIGDTVNLASRLEGANKIFKTRIMVTEETLKNTGQAFLTRELGLIEVKGKAKSVRIFELISGRPDTDPKTNEIITLFHEGLELFREQRLDDAITVFDKLLQRFPDDGAAKFYRDRCKSLHQEMELTDGWDIIKMTSK
ncbi:MAG TPA: adenylate/guanylate cyclase domain-containing protein, partial [Nitrospirae bacterium]|nr:adenylate/guanylate cyclase domain-containing protein [Nitrospirota bacterium]